MAVDLARGAEGASAAEDARLGEDARREHNWKRWGPYLSERQWGTVREDYSAAGTCWDYFPHDHARSRVYRWGEDGLMGLTDREGRLCFALALWNGRDPFLKERLFGLSGPEGNHGEDVKECYFYLDATPTYSYMKGLYKYPQARFPYEDLLAENRRRGRAEPEFDIADSGIYDADRYFDVLVEYAKASPNDVLIRLTLSNRGPEPAPLHVLPTLWFRNTWSWGRQGEGYWPRPRIERAPQGLRATHASLGAMRLAVEAAAGSEPELLFTDNETNSLRLYNWPNPGPYVKDAFHEYVVGGRREAVNPEGYGTKAAACYDLTIPAGHSLTLRLRLYAEDEPPENLFGATFESVFAARLAEAEAFHAARTPATMPPEAARVMRQARAGLLWSKQFYHYIVRDWLDGDPAQPAPPAARKEGRNAEWRHLYNRDVIAMPDKWEYPWYAAWDTAFHMIPYTVLDANFAKDQLVLFLREWYMHPSGKLPAYEFAFDDVNPPVHAWAAFRVYKMSAPRGQRDQVFLARVFQKLLINFTWWVNRKDVDGKNLFSGGFLGLDNIGVFDRSRTLPTGGHLEQADGTAWMAFYCATMLSMALELARDNPAYGDLASKFFEHFVAIADAMNTLGGSGLWDEADGFYYDRLHVGGQSLPLKLRSMVGIIPLFAVEILEQGVIDRLPEFGRRMKWFLDNRADLFRQVSCLEGKDAQGRPCRLLAIPTRERLTRVLRYVLDADEFLGPFGVRSLSKAHEQSPYEFKGWGWTDTVRYEPGQSTSGMFGGNSNWRGPIWFPLNYLLIEALERYHNFYGEDFKVECPVGSGKFLTLAQVARELGRRLASLFLPDAAGRRPCHGDDRRFARDPHWKDLVLFHEYFHGDTGRGLGASHQTGWTALVARLLENAGRREWV